MLKQCLGWMKQSEQVRHGKHLDRRLLRAGSFSGFGCFRFGVKILVRVYGLPGLPGFTHYTPIKLLNPELIPYIIPQA